MMIDSGRRIRGPQGDIRRYAVAFPEDDAEAWEVIELLDIKENEVFISSGGKAYFLLDNVRLRKLSRSTIPYLIVSRIKMRSMIGLTEDEAHQQEMPHEDQNPDCPSRTDGTRYAQLIPRGGLLVNGRITDGGLHL